MKTTSPEFLDQLLDLAEQQARRVLIGTKEQLLPCFALVDKDGATYIVGVPFSNEIQKQLGLAKVKQFAKQYRAVAYSFITEAWMSPEKVAPENVSPEGSVLLREPRPREHPHRIEVVMAMASNGVVSKMRQWRMVRDYRGRTKALEPEGDIDEFRSRFDNILEGGRA